MNVLINTKQKLCIVKDIFCKELACTEMLISREYISGTPSHVDTYTYINIDIGIHTCMYDICIESNYWYILSPSILVSFIFIFTLNHFQLTFILYNFIMECWTLIHRGHVTHVCVRKLSKSWSRWWLVACWQQNQYTNTCWYCVDWTLGNKFQ